MCHFCPYAILRGITQWFPAMSESVIHHSPFTTLYLPSLYLLSPLPIVTTPVPCYNPSIISKGGKTWSTKFTER